MKKWIKFFALSFFSHKQAREGARRGYGNVFLAFVLALVILCTGFVGAEMLPFSMHYQNSPDFMATAYAVLANPNLDTRINIRIENGRVKATHHGCEYIEDILVNTFESESDRQNYSVKGYNVIVDMRPADTLAEFEAYYVSNDGTNTVISYEDYLDLSDAAKYNFEFKLRYTGNALELNDEMVEGFKSYVDSLNGENKDKTEALASDLVGGVITKAEYDRAIYELYFENYYPEIKEYESTSKVPLLRNYYNHQYISQGAEKYLFIFDDYMAGSFETERGIDVSFYGFYSNLEDGTLVFDGDTQLDAKKLVDNFINKSFNAIEVLVIYSYIINVISLVPFIVLMILVVALLAYSILKIRKVTNLANFGKMFKIVGSFVWFSGVIAAIFAVIIAFFVQHSIIIVLPLVLFFVILAIRTVIFAIKESQIYTKQLEQQETEQTEV